MTTKIIFGKNIKKKYNGIENHLKRKSYKCVLRTIPRIIKKIPTMKHLTRKMNGIEERIMASNRLQKLMRFASKGIMLAIAVLLAAFNALPSNALTLQAKSFSFAQPALVLSTTNLSGFESAALANPDCPDSSYSPENIFSLGADGPSPLINDALPAPEFIRNLRSASLAAQAIGTSSMAPDRYDTSAFMTGDIAVGIVLPESSGNGENWTQTETDCVVSKIQTGMNWWKAHASAAANLNFVYDLQIGIPISYEPIQMTDNEASTWVRATMGSMGYTDSSTQERVYSYNDHIRDVNNTDWAFTIFVADSSVDADGKFADGSYFAWAYLGGPYLIMTYDNDGWGIDDMNWVAAHETGHIFLAADQYYQAGYGGCDSTTERYGYLGVVNSNCQYNNPSSVPSIMRINEDTIESTARGQVGWRDSNTNTIPDSMDTNPAFNLTAFTPDPTTQSKLTYSGQVYDIPWSHAVCTAIDDYCYTKDITINTISAVTYRIDGGDWIPVLATDGTYDSDFEAIAFTTPNLSNGLRSIEVKATNSVGHTVTWTDTVTVNSSYTLTVSQSGNGTGTVTSSPAGIDCGATCSANFDGDGLVTLTASAGTESVFTGWSGDNCSGTGTCQLSMTEAASVSAAFTAFSMPDEPLLVQPAEGATVSTSATLEVTVSDANLDSLDVSFYGRAVSGVPADDFSLVAIPDTQVYAYSYPTTYINHLKWIADNKTAANIAFATAVGDLVSTSTSVTEYTRADAAFDTLDAGNVFYSTGAGNHDMQSGTLWPSYFGTSRFSGKSYFGGSYDDYNNYYLFSTAGMDFILINLEFSPTTDQINWADALFKTFSNRRGILQQHDVLNADNSWLNKTSYDTLRANPNLFLILAGHKYTTSDGAAYLAGTGTDGHTIHVVMQDYQDYPDGGNGYLRIYRFSPADDMVYMITYSPTADAFITTQPDRMNLLYDMAGSSAPYSFIGTVSGVASGENASISWSGLSDGTEYQWYAVASDASHSTNSKVWSFTTSTTLTVDKNGTGSGTVTSNPVGIDCGSTCSYDFPYNTVVTLSAVPATSKDRFSGWSGAGCSGTGTCVVTTTAAKSVTASFEYAVFDDVPFGYTQTLGGVTYNLYPYIQALWDNGFTNGIWIEKDEDGDITYALYGPTNNLNRGMVAKFLLNVVHGRDYTVPPLPSTPQFNLDDWNNPDIAWAWPWAEELLAEALTNGCYIDPDTSARAYCPTNISTRAEAAKFGLTMKYGTTYTPPAATGTVFADMLIPVLPALPHWGIAWAEQAYADGLLPACGTDITTGKPLYCPDEPINRAWSAYLIVKSNDLLP